MKEPTINSSARVSDFFGTISQIAWLFAQLPQIWKNYRSKSVDGLALPFLLSWLSGDLTNLLGCLLTEQLPFQRNLAIYFTTVDLILIYQYRAYLQPIPPDYQPLGHHDPNSLSRSLSFSNETETPEERWRRHLRQVSAAQLESPGGLAREYTRSMSRKGRPRQASSQSMGGGGGGGGAMDASFLSTKSDQTPISNAAPVSGGTVVRSPTHDERGRSLARSNHARLVPLSTTTTLWNPNETDRSVSRGGLITSPPRSPQPSVLPSIAFFGIFTFLVFNTAKSYPSETLGGISRAWDNKILAPGLINYDSASSKFPILDQVLNRRSILNLDEPVISPLDWQRLIGRTSAWLCAILYLTSRLPQIWKNFCRKSVEGLSMTLFVMAFLGNLTYVISVLTSPQVSNQAGYLAESFPYLIGSGGTLCFDFTIFIQSKLYSSNRLPRRKRNRTTSRSRSRRRRTIGGDLDIEQQAALLSPTSPPSHLSLATSSRSRSRTESTEMEGSRKLVSPNQLQISLPENDLGRSIVSSPVEEQETWI